MLGKKAAHVGNQILDDGEMRQRINADIAAKICNARGAGQRVQPLDIHGARPAHPLAAGAAKRQGWIDLVFDFQQGVEHHRPAIIQIKRINIKTWWILFFRIIAIDMKFLEARCP